ncbi:ABC transporter permease [Natranaerobius trueperi]|uniref:Spermidine/putrescine ABC transporter ATP-binding protein n=1 Tax=Natranaerobius trueperi TaxID=759412 RepID=A0A226BW30_9FIRM|nr:ABC transporter permease [Natranaerobius trueperi]OWZ83175.1 spermidine/putrescine ABC transporter ATP-binding protein [Natranaerobius trueperi]
MNETNKFLTFFTMLVYTFLIGPLVIITVTAFSGESYLSFPPESFSLQWFFNIFQVDMFVRTFRVSLEIAVIGTVLALLIGIPVAYALSRFDFFGKSILSNFFLSPVVIPMVVLGYALLKFLVINMGIPYYRGLLIGHTIVILPYVVRVISSSLMNFNYTVEEAAMSLGCNRLHAFFVVVLPNIRSGIIAAFILAFINSFNNVPVSVFLTGPGISTLPIQMLSYVEYYFDPTISALSVVLMIITVIIMFAIEKTLGLTHFAK